MKITEKIKKRVTKKEMRWKMQPLSLIQIMKKNQLMMVTRSKMRLMLSS